MGHPLVSVVIPTFNRAYCLSRTIDSALNQTYGSLEVIVVDDGSTDETAELMASNYGQDSRVRYLRQPNQGVSVARNTGMDAAAGEYVALLDSDDLWHPWKTQVQVAVLEAFPDAGMVWTDMEALNPAGDVTHEKYLRTMYSSYRWFGPDDLFDESRLAAEVVPEIRDVVGAARVYCGDVFSQMLMGNLVHTSTVLLRRERLEAVGGFDPELRPSGEDYDFHFRTCREGRVAFVDLATIQYQRDYADQITQPQNAVHFALSYLKTISGVMEREGDRITLPKRMIAEAFAEAHQWIGEEQLELGDVGSARRHLACSLRHRPLQFRSAGLLLLSCLPRGLGECIRTPLRTLKRSVSFPLSTTGS